MSDATTMSESKLRKIIRNAISESRDLVDVHTHLVTPNNKGLVRSGIVELLNYHYCYREMFSWRTDITVEEFWKLSPSKRAEEVWNTFFKNDPKRPLFQLPVSEGMRAVCTILNSLGLDPNEMSLKKAVKYFKNVDFMEHQQNVFEIAGVSEVVRTNNPFDPQELEFYRSGKETHPYYSSALRLDYLVLEVKKALSFLNTEMDYSNSGNLNKTTMQAARNFVRDWITKERLPNVRYVGISFPPDFPWHKKTALGMKMLEEVIIPVCAELGTPLFLMPEPIRGLYPEAKNAGDFVGKMDSAAFGKFAAEHPEVDLWVSPLNFNSQFDITALTCVLPHVRPWSTWWFNHQPDLTQRITRMRMEMIGMNSWFFNSDARVLEHLISKWHHFRQELEDILFDLLQRVAQTSYKITKKSVKAHISTMFNIERIGRENWNSELVKAFKNAA